MYAPFLCVIEFGIWTAIALFWSVASVYHLPAHQIRIESFCVHNNIVYSYIFCIVYPVSRILLALRIFDVFIWLFIHLCRSLSNQFTFKWFNAVLCLLFGIFNRINDYYDLICIYVWETKGEMNNVYSLLYFNCPSLR